MTLKSNALIAHKDTIFQVFWKTQTANEQTRFRHDGKRRFLQLDQEDQTEFNELAQDLKGNPNQTTKKDSREFVKDQLNSPEENKIEIDESFSGYQKGDRKCNRRYVLTGTMVTNGYELKLLAYSLTKPKPPSNLVPNTTQFKLRSILTEFSHSAEVNAAFPQDHYVAGIDPGIHNTATATILDSDTSHHTAITLAMSQGSQTYSARQYLKELSRTKQRKKFAIGNQKLDVNQQDGQNQTVTWTALAGSIVAHVQSVVGVQGYLRRFHGSCLFKMKARYLKQARLATLNKRVRKLLHSAGCRDKWTGDSDRALFAVGDGNFGLNRCP
ncbi:hypothetical protein BGZ49_000458, partial [Haplosporangium sp. Z 27]